MLYGVSQVYFGMLDALLAEEKMPDEYSGKTQVRYDLYSYISFLNILYLILFIMLDCKMIYRSYCAMIVKREEVLHSIGFITNAVIVAPITPGFYDQVRPEL